MPRASFSNGFPPDAPCLDAPPPPVGCRFAFIREARGGWAGGQHPGGWTGAPEGGMPRASFANGFPPDASCLEAPHPSCGTQIMTLIREACGGWAGGQPPGGWTGAPEGGTPPHQIIQRFPTRRLVPGGPPPLVGR